jgi:hypothetical protein
MQMKTGLAAGMGVVFACLSAAACSSELPTMGARARIERSSTVLPNGGVTTQSDATPGGIGGFGSGNVTAQSDTITRGIGGFGSGN